MTDGRLDYKLLKSANLSQKEEKIIKVSVTELKYEDIRDKL